MNSKLPANRIFLWIWLAVAILGVLASATEPSAEIKRKYFEADDLMGYDPPDSQGLEKEIETLEQEERMFDFTESSIENQHFKKINRQSIPTRQLQNSVKQSILPSKQPITIKRPTAPVKQQIGPGGAPAQPNNPIRQPTSPARQPLNPGNQPIGLPTHPIGSPTKPIGSPTQSIGSPTQSIGLPTQPSGSHTQPIGSPMQPNSPVRQPNGPATQPLSPTRQPTRPIRQPINPPTQQTLPTKQKEKPGIFWTLARVTFETLNVVKEGETSDSTFNDTRSAIQQINEIINEGIENDSNDPRKETNADLAMGKNEMQYASDEKMSEEPEFMLTRSLLQRLVRRNVNGLVRLFNIEWRDAINQSHINVREFQHNLGEQVGMYLQDNPNNY